MKTTSIVTSPRHLQIALRLTESSANFPPAAVFPYSSHAHPSPIARPLHGLMTRSGFCMTTTFSFRLASWSCPLDFLVTDTDAPNRFATTLFTGPDDTGTGHR